MTEAGPNSFDLIDAFVGMARWGAGWVLWLMVALAVLLAALVAERSRLFARTRIDAPRLGRALVDHLDRGELEAARTLVARGLALEERVVADGLEAWQRGARAAECIMKSSLERERQRFERYLGTLGTLGSNAPFVGLLGTVIGIVVSFQDLSANPKGGMAVVGPGIAEALVSTAVGLLVAIPAVIAFNHFQGALTRRVGNAELLSGLVLSQLATAGPPGAGSRPTAATRGSNDAELATAAALAGGRH